MTATPRRLSGAIRLAWFVVLVMMLAAAAWSISGKLSAWGMTTWLAWGLSLMFDLAGLICADYARRAVERNSPAGLPRAAILAFVSVSGALNFSHGRDIGGLVAAYGLASISFAVELLFELHRRDVRDEQRANRGLIAERMPHIPVLGWIMYPGRAWNTLRGAVGVRLDLLDPVQTGHAPTAPAERTGHDERVVRSAVRAVLSTFPDATTEDVLDQIAALRLDTDEDTVRAILDTETDTKDSRPGPHLQAIAPAGQSIADSVRTALASGITDKAAVLSYVRKIHGQQVSADTVTRTRNRIERTAS